MVTELLKEDWLLKKTNIWILGETSVSNILYRSLYNAKVSFQTCKSKKAFTKISPKLKREQELFFIIIDEKFEAWMNLLDENQFGNKYRLCFPLYFVK